MLNLSGSNIIITGLFTVYELESSAKNVIWNGTGACIPFILLSRQSNMPTEEKVDEQELAVVVMPGPSAAHFTLNVVSSDNKSMVVAKIVDKVGKQFSMHKTAPNTNFRVGEKSWASGTYLAEIIQGNHRKIVVLVKTKL